VGLKDFVHMCAIKTVFLNFFFGAFVKTCMLLDLHCCLLMLLSMMIGTTGTIVPLLLPTAKGGVLRSGVLFDPVKIVCASKHEGLSGDFWTKNVCWCPEGSDKIVEIHISSTRNHLQRRLII
jgi:hypothetical protein